MYVVSHEKHTQQIFNFFEANPFTNSMGYIEVTSDLEFKELRKATFKAPRFDSFIRNLDSEELESICESKGQYQGWESKSLLVDKLKRNVTIDEVYEHLNNKVQRYYYKKCPKCGSTLYYNKKNRIID